MVRCEELVQKPSNYTEECRDLPSCTYSVLPFTGVIDSDLRKRDVALDHACPTLPLHRCCCVPVSPKLLHS